jgi:uncharacterized membrane-anchored protein YhcB (DUF1043 family)
MSDQYYQHLAEGMQAAVEAAQRRHAQMRKEMAEEAAEDEDLGEDDPACRDPRA